MKFLNVTILASLCSFSVFTEAVELKRDLTETTAVLDLEKRFYYSHKELREVAQNSKVPGAEAKFQETAKILAEYAFKKGDVEDLNLNVEDGPLINRALELISTVLQQSLRNASLATNQYLRLEYTVDSGYQSPIKAGEGKFIDNKSYFQIQRNLLRTKLYDQADKAKTALQKKFLDLLEN